MKIRMRSIITVAAAMLAFTAAQAQDPIFTQYFMAPQAINPGFTGYMETTNIGVLHRSQWPDSDLKITTDYAFVNMWIEDANSGLGVSFLNHRESFTDYNFSQFNGSYSYKVQLDDDWVFRPAIEAGFGSKTYGFQNLVLEDQLNIGTGTIDPVTNDPLALNDKVTFIDISAGMLFSNENAWVGVALKHLNKPEISFTQRGNLPLDMFFSLSGGYETMVSDLFDASFLPHNTKWLIMGNFMKQAEYNRFDLGTQLIFSQAFLGVTAATNPSRNANNSHLLTSLNLLGGLQYQHFKFGYSYDINTSGIGRTGGIHEFSLVYQFDLKVKCLGCPEY
jgi:type IX secretion system PorP/SprF family membrane protein